MGDSLLEDSLDWSWSSDQIGLSSMSRDISQVFSRIDGVLDALFLLVGPSSLVFYTNTSMVPSGLDLNLGIRTEWSAALPSQIFIWHYLISSGDNRTEKISPIYDLCYFSIPNHGQWRKFWVNTRTVFLASELLSSGEKRRTSLYQRC